MRPINLIAVLPLMLLGKEVASAHAFLDHANPRVGSTVSSPPRELTLWFTQNLEAAFSGVLVTNAAGQRIDTGGAHVRGNQMGAGFRPGGAGPYHVHWKVLSVDPPPPDGNFPFRVGQ